MFIAFFLLITVALVLLYMLIMNVLYPLSIKHIAKIFNKSIEKAEHAMDEVVDDMFKDDEKENF